MDYTLTEADKTLINLALREDLGEPFQDVTTDQLFEEAEMPYTAEIRSKQSENIVVSGTAVVDYVLSQLGEDWECLISVKDGELLGPGETLLMLTGDAHILLKAERLILNYLRHLSAIATLTHKFVDKIENISTKVLDTRKTIPGLRALEKHAVKCGGGVNHRMGLYDELMVKDTHVDMLSSMKNVMEKLPEKSVRLPKVVVEVRNKTELMDVLEFGQYKVHRVLLDNMALPELKACVTAAGTRLETEASGNINLENVRMIAQTGVNYVSIGALTHSAGQVDLSMVAV